MPYPLRQRQARRIEDARFRSEVFQQPLGFERQKPAVGTFAQRAVKQKDTRWMGLRCCAQPVNCGHVDEIGVGSIDEMVAMEHRVYLRSARAIYLYVGEYHTPYPDDG